MVASLVPSFPRRFHHRLLLLSARYRTSDLAGGALRLVKPLQHSRIIIAHPWCSPYRANKKRLNVLALHSTVSVWSDQLRWLSKKPFSKLYPNNHNKVSTIWLARKYCLFYTFAWGKQFTILYLSWHIHICVVRATEQSSTLSAASVYATVASALTGAISSFG